MDLNEIFPIRPSELKIFLSVKSYDKKTAEKYRNFYDAEKLITCKISKISIPNFNSTFLRLDSKSYQTLTSLS